MENEHVIAGLICKRAEIAAKISTAQKLIHKLRGDLDAVDRTLLMFNPHCQPSSIRPVIKRKSGQMFRHGDCARAILNALRVALEPMKAAQIVEQIALDCRIAIDEPSVKVVLTRKVKAALMNLHQRQMIVKEGDKAMARWSLAEVELTAG